MNKQTILIIDDEPQIRKLLEITLKSYDYDVRSAENGQEGLVQSAIHPPDLIILDLGLPDMSGHEVLERIREWYQNPIIILSVINSEEDIIKALDNGATDYLNKPFRAGELMARIRASIRKLHHDEQSSVKTFGELQIDFNGRTVRKSGQVIKLTSTEYQLLSLLVRNEGKILTHHFILKEIWGNAFQEESQYLRVYVGQLRKKIELNPNSPKYIITESGVGYRFSAE